MEDKATILAAFAPLLADWKKISGAEAVRDHGARVPIAPSARFAVDVCSEIGGAGGDVADHGVAGER